MRSQRLLRDLTLEELAERSGTTASQLGKVERGDLELRPPQIARLAEALGCWSWQLTAFGDEPDPAAVELLRLFSQLPPPQRAMLLQMTRDLASGEASDPPADAAPVPGIKRRPTAA